MQKINAKRKIKNRKVEKKRKKRGKVRKKKEEGMHCGLLL
jgi:hypothetical protein